MQSMNEFSSNIEIKDIPLIGKKNIV